MSDDFELTDVDRAALSALPRETIPPPALEDTIVRALSARGLLRPSARWSVRLAAIAAAALLFLGGFAWGRRTAPGNRTAADTRGATPNAEAARVVAWF
jgi:hypothetical protein